MGYRQDARKILRLFRTEHDLSQVNFAAKCGISLRSVAKIEQCDQVSDFILNKALDMTGYELEVRKIVKKKESKGDE